jgi:hypothetical protein
VTGAGILARAATLVALLVAGAARGGEGAGVKAAQESAPDLAATTATVSERPRVPAGVLVRATARSAQKRAASAAREETGGARASGGTIESIEIDWNGSGQTP